VHTAGCHDLFCQTRPGGMSRRNEPPAEPGGVPGLATRSSSRTSYFNSRDFCCLVVRGSRNTDRDVRHDPGELRIFDVFEDLVGHLCRFINADISGLISGIHRRLSPVDTSVGHLFTYPSWLFV